MINYLTKVIIKRTVFVYAISLAMKTFRGAGHYRNTQITLKLKNRDAVVR